jgi:hypothetical protein
MQWYEYDKAEEQISVLELHIRQAQEDINTAELSEFSRNAIMNEVQRHLQFIDDIKEQMNEPDSLVDTRLVDTEPMDIVGEDDV